MGQEIEGIYSMKNLMNSFKISSSCFIAEIRGKDAPLDTSSSQAKLNLVQTDSDDISSLLTIDPEIENIYNRFQSIPEACNIVLKHKLKELVDPAITSLMSPGVKVQTKGRNIRTEVLPFSPPHPRLKFTAKPRGSDYIYIQREREGEKRILGFWGRGGGLGGGLETMDNGGLLYHEVQESKLCAVHCVNTVLQGPFFSEFDLAALASDLDRTERQMMVEGGGGAAAQGFLSEESHNVSLDGDFSIQVLQKALEVWDLQVIPLNSTDAGPAQVDPELENAFICHLQDHWFCIRKVNGEWYNFDSLYAAPEHLSKFYLSAYLDSLRGFGWSIFLVRGNFPKECPITSSEASNVYGQWLTPEDAGRITKSCNSVQGPPRRTNPNPQASNPNPEEQLLIDEEDEDLKAAIAASLMDSADAAIPQGENKNSSQENA
ncbi:ataxin-3 homolog [Diospyros lotus]|uniref:ataxin-3 homolog n=1 Tax=Diospyros lotus TaxID=55363 RepID=UPI002253FB6B|nr:ataxin-3 homolog [Diospyros lotus]